MLPVVQELEQRKWVNKHWLTLKDQGIGGNSFTKTSLHSLLTNPVYVGQVTYKQELHAGQQEAIVESGVWQQTQNLLAHNHREWASPPVARERSLLQGLLRCRNCGRAM